MYDCNKRKNRYNKETNMQGKPFHIGEYKLKREDEKKEM